MRSMCKYAAVCPCVSGWCALPDLPSTGCIPFLLSAYESARRGTGDGSGDAGEEVRDGTETV